jgi:hypothetical protein
MQRSEAGGHAVPGPVAKRTAKHSLRFLQRFAPKFHRFCAEFSFVDTITRRVAIFFPRYMLRFSIGEFDSRLCGNPSIERKYADRRSLPVATDRRVNPTLAAYDSRKNQRWLGGIPSLLPVPVQLHRRVGFFVNLFLFLLH